MHYKSTWYRVEGYYGSLINGKQSELIKIKHI